MKKILGREMNEVVLIICPDADGFHGHLVLQYIMYGFGYIIDDPDLEDFREVRKQYPHPVPLVVITVPCRECGNRGVKGVHHLDSLAIYEVDDKGDNPEASP